MKCLSITLSCLLTLCCYFNTANGQTNYASNVKTTVDSDEKRLHIEYDIVANDDTKFFNVEIVLNYEDKQLTPDPNNLIGNQGRAQKAGNKAVFWRYGGEFTGDISKVKVKVIATKELEPVAQFEKSVVSNKGYAPCEIAFKNLSTNADKYEWNFGDPASGAENTSYEKNPIHLFKTGGSHSISLTAIDSKLNLKRTFYETIIIKEHSATVADFQIIGYSPQTPLTINEVPVAIQFKNTSKNANIFSWNFGDPGSGQLNTSKVENPEHKFLREGKYMVELSVESSERGLTDKMSKEVILIQPAVTKKPTGNQSYQAIYDKHRKRKNIWMTAGIVSLGTGAYSVLQSNKLADDYKTATTDAKDIRKKKESYDTIAGIAFGAAAICGVQTYIQARKQSNAKKKLSLNVIPFENGGMLTLSYTFK